MNTSSHTYLAQRKLWSSRQFLQVETPPLHLGGVEACDSPKCGELGSIICDSWGLRSRSPLNTSLVSPSLCSSLPHLYIAVIFWFNHFILQSNSSCGGDKLSFKNVFLILLLNLFFQNKHRQNCGSFHCWEGKKRKLWKWLCTDSLMGQSGNLQPYRFSAFWLRSKCSICSYQLNIWYGLHSRSRILIWFLTDWAYGWACSPGPAGRHGIALPPWVASFLLIKPNYHIVVSTILLCMVLERFLPKSPFDLFFF